jgi:hypothetical protein
MTLLVILALASWGTVLGEYQLTHEVSVMTVAPALMFTSFLVLWPFLGGARSTAKGGHTMQHVVACHACGSLLLPTPRIPFCIACGAFPKVPSHA